MTVLWCRCPPGPARSIEDSLSLDGMCADGPRGFAATRKFKLDESRGVAQCSFRQYAPGRAYHRVPQRVVCRTRQDRLWFCGQLYTARRLSQRSEDFVRIMLCHWGDQSKSGL